MLARSLTSNTRLAKAPASITRPTNPSAARTGIPTATPSRVPTERIAKRRGDVNEDPTTRPVAMVCRSRSRSVRARFNS